MGNQCTNYCHCKNEKELISEEVYHVNIEEWIVVVDHRGRLEGS